MVANYNSYSYLAAVLSFTVGFTRASGACGLPRDPWSQGET